MRDYLQINIKAAPPSMIGDRTTSQCNHVSAQIEFWPTSEIELFRFQKHLKNGNEETVEVERCFWTTWRTTLREHLCMDWSETLKRCQMSCFYICWQVHHRAWSASLWTASLGFSLLFRSCPCSFLPQAKWSRFQHDIYNISSIYFLVSLQHLLTQVWRNTSTTQQAQR